MVTDRTEIVINKNNTLGLTHKSSQHPNSASIAAFNTKRLSVRRKKVNAKLSSYISYISVIALILSIVSVGRSPLSADGSSKELSRAALATARPTVDQVAAADLAAEAAKTADMSVASNVVNLSISLNVKSELAQNDENVLSKPQIVQSNLNTRGIRQYTAVSGDTVQSVATKHGVSEDTVRWANNLASDAIAAGKTLELPMVNGVIYTVKEGDTPDTLAQKYKADKERIITYNDAEIAGIKPGQKVIIPSGVVPETERPGYRAPAPIRSSTPSLSSGLYANTSGSIGNRYAYGYCTYYVYDRRAELGRPVGSLWGDAMSWKNYAQSAGYPVSRTPAVGSVLVDPYAAPPYGHVAVVERVNADGSIFVSEMNYVGWNILSTRTISAEQATAYSYIY